jgi:hypothetical protein
MTVRLPLVLASGRIQQLQAGDSIPGGGGVTISTVAIAFTDGDSLRRVTVTDASVSTSSKILGTVRRPTTANDAEDRGYLYIANVVRLAAGAFDLLVVCLGWGLDNAIVTPNETINFDYTVG